MRRRAKALANAARFRARGASLRRADGSQRSMQVMSVSAARHFTEQAGRSDPCRSCPCPQRVISPNRRVGAIHAGLVHARGPLLRCTGGSERCRSCPCPQRVISPNRRVAAIHAGHVRARSASLRCADGSERSMQVMSVPAARRSAAQAGRSDPCRSCPCPRRVAPLRRRGRRAIRGRPPIARSPHGGALRLHAAFPPSGRFSGFGNAGASIQRLQFSPVCLIIGISFCKRRRRHGRDSL